MNTISKICKKCKISKNVTEFLFLNKKGLYYSYCDNCVDKMRVKSTAELKAKCVEYKGGKCVKCGYNKCHAALDFHHVDSNNKKFTIASKNTRLNFDDYLKEELDKCELLCSNCHREFHYNNRMYKRRKNKQEFKEHIYNNNIDLIKNSNICKCGLYKSSTVELCTTCNKPENRLPNGKELVDLFSKYKVKDICKMYKMSHETLIKSRLKNNISLPHYGFWANERKEPTKEELEIMIWQDTLQNLSLKLNTTPNTIKNLCKKYNVIMPSKCYWSKTNKNIRCYPSKEELQDIVWKMTKQKIAEIYGVKSGSITKLCKRLKIECPPLGYWKKKNS